MDMSNLSEGNTVIFVSLVYGRWPQFDPFISYLRGEVQRSLLRPVKPHGVCQAAVCHGERHLVLLTDVTVSKNNVLGPGGCYTKHIILQ